MSARSETGHAKNVANFEDLISFCTGYGVAYNPANAQLSLAKLKQLFTDARNALNNVKVAKTGFDNATNERQSIFKDLKPLATRILNSLAASGASNLTIGNARTINRKIQGTRASAKKAPLKPADPADTNTEHKRISASQASFDSMIDHFSKLLQTVSQTGTYKPNEEELKVDTLKARIENLSSTNTLVADSYTAWSNSRIERNNTLYASLTGLVQTAQDVKKYIKSVFGASSQQFDQVSGLEFKMISVI